MTHMQNIERDECEDQLKEAIDRVADLGLALMAIDVILGKTKIDGSDAMAQLGRIGGIVNRALGEK